MIRTTQGGTIIARAGAGRQWQPGGKVMFVENGRLRFDVGWVGATGAETPVNDGEWNHVAVTVERTANGDNVHCYVDGRLGGSGSLDVTGKEESRLPVKIGFCNENFPNGQSAFVGDVDDVRWYAYALSAEQIRDLCRRGQAALPAHESRSASLPLASPERGFVSSHPATTWEHALDLVETTPFMSWASRKLRGGRATR